MRERTSEVWWTAESGACSMMLQGSNKVPDMKP